MRKHGQVQMSERPHRNAVGDVVKNPHESLIEQPEVWFEAGDHVLLIHVNGKSIQCPRRLKILQHSKKLSSYFKSNLATKSILCITPY